MLFQEHRLRQREKRMKKLRVSVSPWLTVSAKSPRGIVRHVFDQYKMGEDTCTGTQVQVLADEKIQM
jgi:hypothetical protein